MYKASDKMSELMGASSDRRVFADNQVLQLLHRFGVPLGVSDKTIEAVCQENGVDCRTLLTVVNFALQHDTRTATEVDIPTLRMYLENAHTYFLDFQLPRIRQILLEAISLSDADNKIPMLIIRFFDEYVKEIRAHIQHENDYSFAQHATDDKHIAVKAHELKNLIIKYYPRNIQSAKSLEQNRLLYAVLDDLQHFEKELALHCAIEDEIMLPALEKAAVNEDNYKKQTKEDDLSARERDILIEIVRGCSNKQIADKLCLSTHTVMSHRKNIARKLNIHSIAGLTIYAIVNGIVDLASLEDPRGGNID